MTDIRPLQIFGMINSKMINRPRARPRRCLPLTPNQRVTRRGHLWRRFGLVLRQVWMATWLLPLRLRGESSKVVGNNWEFMANHRHGQRISVVSVDIIRMQFVHYIVIIRKNFVFLAKLLRLDWKSNSLHCPFCVKRPDEKETCLVMA